MQRDFNKLLDYEKSERQESGMNPGELPELPKLNCH